MKKIIVEKIIADYLEENTYILNIDNEALVIDPGANYKLILSKLQNKKLLGILITHHHSDHIGTLSFFKNIPVYSFDNLQEKEYKIGLFKFEVIYNPGHSEDSISFYFRDDNILFSGDFIFYENIGRCDLSGGNYNQMLDSIKKIKKYSSDMKIYPGHGKETTLEHEINNNYYF